MEEKIQERTEEKTEEKAEEKGYMISDVAKQVKVESHVLRYWEDELELSIKRNKLGHRYYTAEDIERLKSIKMMKEQGFQLKAIKTALRQQAQNRDKADAGYGGSEKGEVFIIQKEMYQPEKEDKAYRLQMMLKQMMLETIKEGNAELCEALKESILKELDYQFRMQEEREDTREAERQKREEEHYRQIDEMLREKMEKKEKRKKHSFF